MDLIGPDCIDIILEYKREFERLEYNSEAIDNCVFEEINKEEYEKVFDMEDYINSSERLIKKYSLDNMTIGEFQDYYVEQHYIQAVTFKFSIMGKTDDYFQADIRTINSDYMKNVKIKYIYKLNTFEICLFLGDYYEGQLEELYEHIARDIWKYPNQVEVIILPRF